MPYCLSCGRLRDTNGGYCRECCTDFNVRRTMEARSDYRRIMRNEAREKRLEKSALTRENS